MDWLTADNIVSQYIYKVNETATIYLVDDFVDSMYVTKTWFIGGLISFYLYFSLKLGPSIMAKRKPMNLKMIIVVYNIFQLIINCSGLSAVVFNGRFLRQTIYFICNPLGDNDIMELYACHAIRCFLVIKILDLLDTIFLVLTKKFDHITHLHLFHHTSMVATVWLSITFLREHAAIMAGVINLFVHALMYTYYLLCAWGPKTRHIAQSWKATLTRIQIGQFLIILCMFSAMYLLNCSVNPAYLWIWAVNVSVILVFFLNFYYKSYILKANGPKESQVKKKCP